MQLTVNRAIDTSRVYNVLPSSGVEVMVSEWAIRNRLQDNLPMGIVDSITQRQYILSRDENGGLVLTEVVANVESE